MRSVALRCIGVEKGYGGAPAVQALDMSVESGTIMALVGPSGCGKTTTLRLIAGFEHPDSGAIILGGRIVAGRGVNVPPEKRRVGMVFQDYALFPHLTVAQNVAFGLPKGQERAGHVDEALRMVGLAGLRHRSPHELSGGEQQRVALARALAPQPEILLLDEPFSNLHANLRAEVRAEVREILRGSGTSAVLVTHDQEEALFMGDVVAVQNNGRLEQVDTPERIFHSPNSRFVAQFMGAADFLAVGRSHGMVHLGVNPTSKAEADRSGDLEVMLRPDDLLIQPAEPGAGRIVGRSFQGATYLYTVALKSGLTLRSTMPHTERYPVGMMVSLQLTPAHPPRCFVDGRSAGDAPQALVALVRERFLEETT